MFTAGPSDDGPYRRRECRSDDRRHRAESIFLSRSILKDQSTERRHGIKRPLTRNDLDAGNAAKRSLQEDLLRKESEQGEGKIASRLRSDEDWRIVVNEALDDAIRNRSARTLLQCWVIVQEKLRSVRKEGDYAILDRLWIKFLTVSMVLRQAELAVSIWNVMVKSGHAISIKHWTAMLQGCTKARDVSSMKMIWANLLQSNIAPDTLAWTAYIQGLVKCHRCEEGLDALDQLGRTWDVPSEDATYPATSEDPWRPRIAPVNAALAALIDVERFEIIPAVLGWAERQSIPFDAYTYNTLLRHVALKGNLKTIRNHLQEMSANKCPPDTTTFSTILHAMTTGAKASFRNLDPEEQERMIFSLFDEMVNFNVKPNSYTYSTTLSALLLFGSSPHRRESKDTQPMEELGNPVPRPNLPAAHAVLAHMHKNNVIPTPHIHAILLKYYFNLEPPDLYAVRNLWDTICSTPGSSASNADGILYDRMIQGLSENDQLDDAEGLLKKMVEEGKAPAWFTLSTFLDALRRAEDWRRVRWLVEKVEKEAGFLRWGERDMRGRRKWDATVAHLKSMGIVAPQQQVEGRR